MLELAVRLLIQKLNQQLLEKTVLFAGVIKHVIEDLHLELQRLRSFVEDVSWRLNEDFDLNKKTIKTVNEAEDAVDKLVTDAKLIQNKGIIIELFLDMKIKQSAMKIKSITDKLGVLRRNGAYLCSPFLISEVPVEKEAPIVEEDEVVGFDGEANEIVNRLVDRSTGLEVIPIVGMPGLGKTTLANKIFKDIRVERKFPIRIWIYISQSYNRRELFLNIIRKCSQNTIRHHEMTFEVLVNQVRKLLEKKKCLIVLDDLWTCAALDDIGSALRRNDRGSRILLTTQDTSVANYCHQHPHYLKLLPDSECWKLIKKKVLHKDKYCPPDLEQLGNCIAKKCMGLPFAALVIAKALNGKGETRAEWEQVHQRVSEDITSRDFEITKRLLQTSYDSLDLDLRACFLYCGVFPRGFEIPAWKLVRLWIAEGLITEGLHVNDTLENIADHYLDELARMNLVMVSQWSSDDRIKTFHVHDIIHEFCRQKASEENLFQEVKVGVELSFPRKGELAKYRRLCINSSVVEFVSTKPYSESISSFLCFSSENIMISPNEVAIISKAFPLAKVFDVESVKFDCFSPKFLRLYHLRYIAFSNDSIKVLPKFIGDLWNLQTLIVVTQQKTIDIQADIFNMPKLRHLHTNASAKLCSQKSSKLVSVHGSLQTLSTVEPESCTEHVVARCQNMKKLGIRGKIAVLLGANKPGKIFNVNKLKCLEKLKLINDDNLTGLELHLPSENNFPKSLRKLTLSGTSLDWKYMGILGKLEELEVLKLKENAFVGSVWVSTEGGFPSLEVLWIERTDLISWGASSNHLPRLKRLVLIHCDKLAEVPIELADIRSLRRIELVDTTSEATECARRIESCSKCIEFKLSISDSN
ncbi:putative late blight resistance protein homolog R1B-8 [Lycium barbarum]|uniref:putative late blight resistance protein homolog R1B-8 n=1 Tax=Lycium barbarum TaxID=112863 RepID=UPI00293E2826|nr:putative late blight resistance protein homolog R1B-8 [Lycium barbarum]